MAHSQLQNSTSFVLDGRHDNTQRLCQLTSLGVQPVDVRLTGSLRRFGLPENVLANPSIAGRLNATFAVESAP